MNKRKRQSPPNKIIKEKKPRPTKEEQDLILLKKRSQRSIFHCDSILVKLYNPFKIVYDHQNTINSSYFSQNTPVWSIFRKYAGKQYRTLNATTAAKLISNPDTNSEFQTFRDTFNTLIGKKIEKEFTDNWYTKIGQKAEALAIATAGYRWMKHCGSCKINCYRPGTVVKQCSLSKITIAASPDAVFKLDCSKKCIGGSVCDGNVAVEAKTWQKDRNMPTCLAEVPTQYLVQLALQMFVTDCPQGILIIFDQENPDITSNRHFCIKIQVRHPYTIDQEGKYDIWALHDTIAGCLETAVNCIETKNEAYLNRQFARRILPEGYWTTPNRFV